MATPARVVVPTTLPRALQVFLSIWVFSAFLTQLSVVPAIRNNLGPFEICALLGVLLIPAFRLREFDMDHGLLRVLLLITGVALISQLQVEPANRQFALIQVAIMAFLLFFVSLLHNIVVRHRISPEFFLRNVTYAVLLVGPWIVMHGVRTGGDIQAAGPFRSRAHMAAYMLTAFWLVLIYLLWPGIKQRSRYLAFGSLALALYAIAISGRRSVYLSLLIGLLCLAFVFFGANRGRRMQMLIAALFVAIFLGGLYLAGDALGPRTAFFKERVTQIDDRVRQAAGLEVAEHGNSFFLLQRQGVAKAFRESPILGIGWGGFAKSRFSPTGHEVHSTPLRFLAELGVVGLVLYAALMWVLLAGSLRLFRSMRKTPYGASYLAMTVAIWSMSVSYLYNRHVTERTFWLFLVVFLAAATFSRRWHLLNRRLVPSGARAVERRPEPKRPALSAMGRAELQRTPVSRTLTSPDNPS